MFDKDKDNKKPEVLKRMDEYYKAEKQHKQRRISKPAHPGPPPVPPPNPHLNLPGVGIPGPQGPAGPPGTVPPQVYDLFDKVVVALEKIVARLDDLERRMSQRCHCGEVTQPGDYLCSRCRDNV